MSDQSGRVLSWADMPERPWPEATEPPTEALADYLTSLTREQLLWLLERQRGVWAQDSRCFMEDHEGRVEHAERIIREANDYRQRGYDAGFEDARTRALEVIRDH